MPTPLRLGLVALLFVLQLSDLVAGARLRSFSLKINTAAPASKHPQIQIISNNNELLAGDDSHKDRSSHRAREDDHDADRKLDEYKHKSSQEQALKAEYTNRVHQEELHKARRGDGRSDAIGGGTQFSGGGMQLSGGALTASEEGFSSVATSGFTASEFSSADPADPSNPSSSEAASPLAGLNAAVENFAAQEGKKLLPKVEHLAEKAGKKLLHGAEHLGEKVLHGIEHLPEDVKHLGKEAFQKIKALPREMKHLAGAAVHGAEHLAHDVARGVKGLAHRAMHDIKHGEQDVVHGAERVAHRVGKDLRKAGGAVENFFKKLW